VYEESRGEQVWESLVAPGAGGWGTVVEGGERIHVEGKFEMWMDVDAQLRTDIKRLLPSFYCVRFL
jgi:hypothetical protein